MTATQNPVDQTTLEPNNQKDIKEATTSKLGDTPQEVKCEIEKRNVEDEDETDMLLRSAHGVVAVDPRHGPPVAVMYAGPPSIQMATWGDRNGSARSARARSAHGQAQKGPGNGS